MSLLTSDGAIYAVAALATLGVVARPWRLPEATWAVAGGVALVVFGPLAWSDAAEAVQKGDNVYMFLVGTMLLSELARREGLFDYLAALCVRRARGSAPRLFLFVYIVGTVVTVFMSNDATAVVLTPAVLAVSRKAKARALPYLLACAFIANAASFVLPISNPANLVVFGDRLPSLMQWMGRFVLPSVLAVVATYGVLRVLCSGDLRAPIAEDVDVPALSASGKLSALGIGASTMILLGASAFGISLGLPTLAVAVVVLVVILARKRESPRQVLADVSWSVLPLVAGLFVLVEGLQHAGAIEALTSALQTVASTSATGAALAAGSIVALACNLMNNLPAGLIAGLVVGDAQVTPLVQSAVAIGIDLGPNLSVTGSLATILWLLAIRREGEDVTAWQFLRVGAVAMPVALALALLVLLAQASV